jgi:hypothetical protein
MNFMSNILKCINDLKWWIIALLIVVGILIVAFSGLGSFPFWIGVFLIYVALLVAIYCFSIQDFWPRNLFLILILAFFIGYLMIISDITSDKIQLLLTMFITINIAIITIAFAAIAISPKSFIPIKEDFRNFLFITAFWILLEILCYCFSFFDLFNKSIAFKVFLALSTIIQIVLIFNLMFYTIKMFDFLVVPDKKNGVQ